MKSILQLLFLITVFSMTLVSCDNNPAEPKETKEFRIWTLESQMGQGILYYNSPDNFFDAAGINLTGVSSDMILRYLAHGGDKLYSVGCSDWYAKKICRIDPKTGIIVARDITSALLDNEPEGLAYGNGFLWCMYMVSGGFRVSKIDPQTLEETEQDQFSFNYPPDSRRIRGIDIDEANNLLWVGVAVYPIVGYICYVGYDAYDLTSGSMVKSVQPNPVISNLWAGDIKIGENYIWSTTRNNDHKITILKTDKETGTVQSILAEQAGSEGITF